MDDQNTTEPTENPEVVEPADPVPGSQPLIPEPGTAPSGDETEPDTFPRSVVEELRYENGKYRQRAQRADDLARRLHAELVRATGRLADPSDLEFDEAHLDDADTLSAAVDELLARKPHLARRRPAGDIGQGATSTATPVDLAAILGGRA